MGSMFSRAISQNGSMSPPDAYIPEKERRRRIKKEKELAEMCSPVLVDDRGSQRESEVFQ
jgi:hypothetical protein